MSRDELHQIAQMDTPASVDIPKTWQGLIAWAIVRVGPALVLSVAVIGATMWAVNKVYSDLAETNRIVLELVRAQSQTNGATAAAIQELSKQVENNTKAMEDAHRRASLR